MTNASALTGLCSRRAFLGRAALASAAAWSSPLVCAAAETSALLLVVFTKAYQALNLDFEESAALTAEAGLDGIDCPLRPGGEVLPERAADDLPRYVAALRRRKLQMPLLTTAITNIASPYTEQILRTAKEQGVQCYRLGFIEREKDVPAQIREVKARLKDLAALNQRIGLGALLQNHSPMGHTYLGGDLTELRELVSGFEPAQIGVAFDIGHALIVHGDGWRPHFEALKSHLRIAYVKDATRDGHWVRFGQGDIAGTGYFKLLKEIHYHAPVCLHLEFDWTQDGQTKTRAALLQALRESAQTLKQWLV